VSQRFAVSKSSSPSSQVSCSLDNEAWRGCQGALGCAPGATWTPADRQHARRECSRAMPRAAPVTSADLAASGHGGVVLPPTPRKPWEPLRSVSPGEVWLGRGRQVRGRACLLGHARLLGGLREAPQFRHPDEDLEGVEVKAHCLHLPDSVSGIPWFTRTRVNRYLPETEPNETLHGIAGFIERRPHHERHAGDARGRERRSTARSKRETSCRVSPSGNACVLDTKWREGSHG
jgi:hypothetical protein